MATVKLIVGLVLASVGLNGSHLPGKSDGAVANSTLRSPHNVHVTYATLGIEKNVVVAQVKYFKHDLEKAVSAFAKVDSVSLGVSPSSDSLYLAYLNSTFVILQDDQVVGGRVLGSGEAGEMWWYQILYEAPSVIHELTVVNKQLIEIFRDQKNILKAEHLGTGKRKAFYFNKKVVQYNVAF